MRDGLPGSSRSAGLVDVLDRVLDKGLVVAGDIKVSLAEVELLTIRVRLIVCSLDKAEQIGLDWWKHDRYLSPGSANRVVDQDAILEHLKALERKVAALEGRRRPPSIAPKKAGKNQRAANRRKQGA
jgi:hypothetical protein